MDSYLRAIYGVDLETLIEQFGGYLSNTDDDLVHFPSTDLRDKFFQALKDLDK